jgi:hypothetical protein
MGPEVEIVLAESAAGVQIARGAQVRLDGAALPAVRNVSIAYEPQGQALVTVTILARRVAIHSGDKS